MVRRAAFFRKNRKTRPLDGEKNTTSKYIAVAVTAIAGPGLVSKIMDINIPIFADINPSIAEMMITFFNRLASNKAVEDGVISIATTKITPTLLKAETTANESRNG